MRYGAALRCIAFGRCLLAHRAPSVLLMHALGQTWVSLLTANVAKFAIFENQKALSFREFRESSDRALVPIVHDIRVGFQDHDTIANFLSKRDQLVTGADIGTNAEVRVLDGHEME